MRYACLAVLMFFLFALPAGASEVRTMTLDNETSTSDCIGDPKTPLCAAETVEACFIRLTKDLCETVGADFSPYEGGTPHTPDSYVGLYQHTYKHKGTRTLSANDIPPQFGPTADNPWKPNDVAVKLRWTACIPEDECIVESRDDPTRGYGEGCPASRCRIEPSGSTYILRSTDDGWRIVEWYLEPVLHGDFWNRK